MFATHFKRQYTLVTTLVACTLGTLSLPSMAADLEGCQSAPILEKFEQFGATGRMPRDLGMWLGNPEAQAIEPYKVFDNVDYVGICWVSSWVIKTSEGAVLIDTLYGPFTDQLIGKLDKVGVKPEEVKYVLITHGHFDHAGGAYTLKSLLPNARFVMTAEGFAEAKKGAERSAVSPRAWKMIEPDMVVYNGTKITLGDNVFTAYATPGHTPGTASYEYTVKDGNKSYQGFTVGGLGMNAIKSQEQAEDYIGSVDAMLAMLERDENPLQVHLSAHGFSNNLPENAAKLQTRQSGELHSMVDGEGFKQQLWRLRGIAEERVAIEKAKKK
ncbi:MBL fold metallo-hydrolase [Marinomonas transparens]|uniref:MBL fold metallo-hydrolase n=1 Tax=Marinomonas transparens TaxID=2795388 RepID=A0A934MXR5_9GAMM|nr:MBL fold metallo-hydrolase [Marinomonas transparens]MBJ7539604.1 MBL fold metallo-hydrolase [Marinomonas transparens]